MNLFKKTLSKMFKSSNQQELDKIKPIINAINDHENKVISLKENEFKSKEELNKIQQQLLSSMLEGAMENVPFYRQKNISKPDLSEFPIVERDDVFDSPEDFISEKYELSSLIKLYTGGSTGSPLSVYLSKSIRQKSYAFWNLFYNL